MGVLFTPLSELKGSIMEGQIKVRIIRLWTNLSDAYDGIINSIDMLLLDSQNNKIQATVPYHLVRRFTPYLKENHVYIMSNFRLIHNISGSVVAHNHSRIIFAARTEVVPSQSIYIDPYGLTLLTAKEILDRKYGDSCLVDTIGLVMAFQFDFMEVSSQFNMTPVVKFELADHSGRFACSLSGNYAVEFRDFMSTSSIDHPIVVLQFAKTAYAGGFVFVENYKEITRMMFDPPIPQAYKFKVRLNESGGIGAFINLNPFNSVTVTDITPFDRLYPHKTVRDFVETSESGLFILCAKVIGLYSVNKWWYPTCVCGTFLEICHESYYCSKCSIHVFSVSPKCNLQIAIDDGTSKALIQMSEQPLQGIHSLNHSVLGTEYAIKHYGPKAFNGKDILLIAHKSAQPDDRFDGFVEILNMTDEEGCVSRFHLLGNDFTPTKSIVVTPFTKMLIDYVDSQPIPADTQFINNGKMPVIEVNDFSALNCLANEAVKHGKAIKGRKKLLGRFKEFSVGGSSMDG